MRVMPLIVGVAVLSSGAARADDELWYRGRVDLRYVFRSTGESAPRDRDTDQDLIQDAFVEGGLGQDMRFEVSGRVREDIDGRPDVSRFRDIHDSYDENVHAYLYTAYGEARELGPLATARLGRQYRGEDIEVRFDGALVESKPIGEAVKLTAYGGVPAFLWESSPSGDGIVGGAAELVAIPRTTARFEYVHLTDRRRDTIEPNTGLRQRSIRDDDLFLLVVNHRVDGVPLRVQAKASTFEGKSSRLSGEAVWADEDGFRARGRYVLQLGAYRDLSIAFSPLDEVLDEYEPYSEVLGDLSQDLDEHWTLTAGGAVRRLHRGSDEGAFNHEFIRLYGQAAVTDLPWKGLRATLLGEGYWSDEEDRTFQLSGDLAQDLGDFTVSAGTTYAAFRFDEIFLEERQDVRTVAGAVEWRATELVRVRAGYTFEVDDEDRYHVARCDARLSF